MMTFPRFESSAVNGLCVTLADQPSEALLDEMCRIVACLRNEMSDLIIDIVPAYVSVTVYFDDNQINRYQMQRHLMSVLQRRDRADISSHVHHHRLPVWYDAEYCPDLQHCARTLSMSEQAVIDLHLGMKYRVYAIGFSPGFAYLGQLNPRLAMPRHTRPRLRVPSGAVAIAEQQTAIYPLVSPGGWQVIGLCPTPLVNMDTSHIGSFAVGDVVEFYPITQSTYESMGGQLHRLEFRH